MSGGLGKRAQRTRRGLAESRTYGRGHTCSPAKVLSPPTTALTMEMRVAGEGGESDRARPINWHHPKHVTYEFKLLDIQYYIKLLLDALKCDTRNDVIEGTSHALSARDNLITRPRE